MNAPRAKRCVARQRGAVTAIMTLILLAVIGYILVIALNMAGSDVYDTAAQNSSTEALFLAESGVERAGKRFAATPGQCNSDGLQEAPIELVAGSSKTFEILTSTRTSATECTIRARGKVGAFQRTIEVLVLRAGGGGGVVIDNTFDDPNRWDGDAAISGGVANFNRNDKETKAEKKDPPTDPENGIATIDPPPGAVALTLSFDYVVSGTIQFQVQVKFEGGGGGTITVDTGNLSGSGSYSLAIGTRDPNTIKEIVIKAQQITGSETATMDNLYLGPTGGGGATVTLRTWREIVSP